MTDLRFAIVSDIHADEVASEDSHIGVEPPEALYRQHPIADLAEFIAYAEIKADYLLVPGDLTNKANGLGLIYAWRRLHELARLMSAELVAVPGNHDVVTHAAAVDRRSALKNLSPSFPIADATLAGDFWRDGWAVIEKADHRLLLLDSTVGFPAYPEKPRDGEEWRQYLAHIDRGGLTSEIESALSARLRAMGPKLNIAIVHHHPQEHQERAHLQDGYGPMYRGGELISMLSAFPAAGRWIVIHGHKHIPQLAHATATTSNGPLVLCAASLGGRLWHPINTVTRNQFHVLSASNGNAPGVGSIRGRVESYTWGFGEGWATSEQLGAGLPAEAGFGSSDDFRVIAARIESLFEEGKLSFVSMEDLVVALPQLPFMLPSDFRYLEEDLRLRGLGFLRLRGRVVQVVREV